MILLPPLVKCLFHVITVKQYVGRVKRKIIGSEAKYQHLFQAGMIGESSGNGTVSKNFPGFT